MKDIVDKIKSGDEIAYDTIYLVDSSKRKFTPEKLEAYIEKDLEPIGLKFSIYSIFFEED